jgi:hypothetical protein
MTEQTTVKFRLTIRGYIGEGGESELSITRIYCHKVSFPQSFVDSFVRLCWLRMDGFYFSIDSFDSECPTIPIFNGSESFIESNLDNLIEKLDKIHTRLFTEKKWKLVKEEKEDD